jgi:hypothetical protein
MRQCGLAKDVARVFCAFRQNMSRVFARKFGKRRCEHLEAGGHTAEHTIPYPLTIGNVV